MELLTVKQAADRLAISTQTLRRWSQQGLVSTITLPSGHRRYRAADIDALTRPDKADA
jgi:excisionase family DNA binding protein